MKKPYMIGLAGGSASGKSTLADRLEEKLSDLDVKIFHMDEYYKEESMRPVIKGLWNGKEYVDDNHPQALDLEQFHKDAEQAAQGEWDIILIEGVFALWDEQMLPLYDLKLYVDCNEDERLSRRIKRHLSFGQDLEEITERYIQAVQPRYKEFIEPGKWKADMIINGCQMPSLGSDMIESWIRRMVNGNNR